LTDLRAKSGIIETSIIRDTVRAEPFDKLRTGLVEAPLPFDRLRADGCGFVMSSGKINKTPTGAR